MENCGKTATYAIADDDTKESFEALKEILATSKDPEVQKASLYAIADNVGPGGSEILMQTAISNPKRNLQKLQFMHLLMQLRAIRVCFFKYFKKQNFLK